MEVISLGGLPWKWGLEEKQAWFRFKITLLVGFYLGLIDSTLILIRRVMSPKSLDLWSEAEVRKYEVYKSKVPLDEGDKKSKLPFPKICKRIDSRKYIFWSALMVVQLNLTMKLKVLVEKHVARVLFSQITRSSPNLCEATIEKCLACSLVKVAYTTKKIIGWPLSLAEMSKAFVKWRMRKYPGADGLPCEFYKVMWEDINDDYFQMAEELEENSLTTAMEAIQTHCRASDSKLSDPKAEVWIIGTNTIPAWLNPEWKIIQPGVVVRYIGISFGVDIPASEMSDFVIKKLQENMSSGRPKLCKQQANSRFMPKALAVQHRGDKGPPSTVWSMCNQPKDEGFLAMIDIQLPGEGLCIKWVAKTSEPDSMLFPKRSKGKGSEALKATWKAWDSTIGLITKIEFLVWSEIQNINCHISSRSLFKGASN
eukprot:Gb_41388 [translate_table: standard]